MDSHRWKREYRGNGKSGSRGGIMSFFRDHPRLLNGDRTRPSSNWKGELASVREREGLPPTWGHPRGGKRREKLGRDKENSGSV